MSVLGDGESRIMSEFKKRRALSERECEREANSTVQYSTVTKSKVLIFVVFLLLFH